MSPARFPGDIPLGDAGPQGGACYGRKVVEEVDVEDVGVTSKTALMLDDETESGWNRRSTDRQSGSSQRSAVVGKLGSDKSPNLSSTLPSSRHSAKAAERHELIHPTQSRPSNEAKIVDNNKFRPLYYRQQK